MQSNEVVKAITDALQHEIGLLRDDVREHQRSTDSKFEKMNTRITQTETSVTRIKTHLTLVTTGVAMVITAVFNKVLNAMKYLS